MVLKKLAIISTHPIQYNAPFFALLHKRAKLALKVFYTWSQAVKGEKYDPGFGTTVHWDIPLLDGYPWEAVNNTSEKPGSEHYHGIINPGLIEAVSDFNPDAILVYGWNFKSHFILMRHFKGKIKVIFRGDSTLLNEEGLLKTMLRKMALRFVYHYIDYALYVGKANKAYFRFAGLQERQMVFMPHAVENSRFASCETKTEEIAELKKQWKIPPQNLVLLYSGKLTTNKNIHSLCIAIAALQHKPVSLLIAGSGPLGEKLKKDFAHHPQIIFLGFQNQERIPLLYAIADLVVLPSKKKNETWGLCLNEGMAAGKAVIASDGCGAAYDLVEHGMNGYVFPVNDFGKLQEHVAFLADRPELVKKMGEASKKIISDYSFEKGCMALEKLMEDIS